MLINTLFLFLHELLPVFLLIAMLRAMIPPVPRSSWIIIAGTGMGVFFCLPMTYFSDSISQIFNGTGLELLRFSAVMIQFLSLTWVLVIVTDFRGKTVSFLLTLMLALLTLTSSSNFLVFIATIWNQETILKPLLLGLFTGAGISASLAVLLYFLLCFLRSWLPLAVYIFPVLFTAGHLAETTNLLAQIGFLESEVIWSTQSLLSDQTELAQILSSLFGYEASPIRWQIYVYLVALCVLSTIMISRRQALRHALNYNEVQQ